MIHDLDTWSAAPTQIISDTITSSETEQITIRLPESSTPYFGRIHVLATPPIVEAQPLS